MDWFGHHDCGVRAYGECVCCRDAVEDALQGCGCKQLHEDAGENLIAHKRRACRFPSAAARTVLTSSATHNRLWFVAFARFGKGLRKNMAMALAWSATPISSATYNTFDLIFCVFLLFVKRNRKSLCACFTNV